MEKGTSLTRRWSQRTWQGRLPGGMKVALAVTRGSVRWAVAVDSVGPRDGPSAGIWCGVCVTGTLPCQGWTTCTSALSSLSGRTRGSSRRVSSSGACGSCGGVWSTWPSAAGGRAPARVASSTRGPAARASASTSARAPTPWRRSRIWPTRSSRRWRLSHGVRGGRSPEDGLSRLSPLLRTRHRHLNPTRPTPPSLTCPPLLPRCSVSQRCSHGPQQPTRGNTPPPLRTRG